MFYFSFKDGANIVKKIKGTYSFKVKNKSGSQGVWFVDAKTGSGSVSFGDSSEYMLLYFHYAILFTSMV